MFFLMVVCTNDGGFSGESENEVIIIVVEVKIVTVIESTNLQPIWWDYSKRDSTIYSTETNTEIGKCK